MMPKPKPFLYLAFLGLLAAAAALAFSGCAANRPPAPSTQPPLGTRTFVPGPALPVLAGTPVPMPREPITPANVGKLRELAIWGKGRISQVSYSPDGRLLAVGTAAGIWLYDAQTLAELRFIETERPANTLIFAPDGQTLTAVLSTTTLSTWNITSGQRLESIPFKQPIKTDSYWTNPDYAVGSVSSPDGTTLAAMTDLSHIGLWNAKSGDRLRVVDAGGIDGIHHLALSPKGTLLASASNLAITVWDMEQSTRSQIPTGYQSHPLAFSPNGKLLSDGAVLWDAKTLRSRCILENSPTFIGSVAFSPDGRLLAAGVTAEDTTIKLWEVETCRSYNGLAGHQAKIFSLAFSPDGTRLASGSWDSTVRTWNVERGWPISAVGGYAPSVSGLAISPDKEKIYVAPAFFGTPDDHLPEREIQVWSVATGQVASTLKGHTMDIQLALAANGKLLVSSNGEGSLTLVWDTETGRRLRAFDFYEATTALSPDGQEMATTIPRSHYSVVRDAQTGNKLYMIKGEGTVFAPDGLLLAALSDNKLCLWDARTGELLHELTLHGGYQGLPTFSPDSKIVAMGGADGTVLLWDVQTERMTHTLQGAADEVMSVAFSPDGAVIASGSRGYNASILGSLYSTLSLWDVRTGTLLKAPISYTSDVYGLAFSSDGTILVSRSSDGTVRLWGIAP